MLRAYDKALQLLTWESTRASSDSRFLDLTYPNKLQHLAFVLKSHILMDSVITLLWLLLVPMGHEGLQDWGSAASAGGTRAGLCQVFVRGSSVCGFWSRGQYIVNPKF